MNKRSSKSLLISVALFVVTFITVFLVVVRPWEQTDLTDLDTVDLTTMNSTMVYAYVNDMVNTRPEDYLGKTIKASGQYAKTYYSGTEKYYHYVVISDATACCEQGLEFLFEGDYPSEGDNIIIIGTFESYVEVGITYYYVKTTEIQAA